ncbi:sodium/potassium/calcium exchanger 3 isoform X1 [Xiphias gladius]|uniref:sodium/potassium/calcium exchanger 3 isoform X1 n=1 Tax=Xiphias gladius TaxID=8245 RepID=UPI001A98B0C5|nr:sodium/potassium/calcium exchanger 3 isoform X1 [Xiphias gladius]XP_040007058.1 sodium/potassium/calcium exchanger 3 isoform X1 [Xiphias gladius]
MRAAARHRRPFQRFCCCGLGLVAVIWLTQVIQAPETESSGFRLGVNGGTLRWTRRLMQEKSDNQSLDQPRAAIHEFPEDIFTKEQRKKGAVFLHALCAIYMFYALAIVCDDYFVPSLEKISENLQLSEDVAGATFMAAGSSAPELFTSLIGVFITKGDVGVGTIVGSAVFNILVIIGLSGIFAGQTVTLTWWSLFRDSTYYILSVLTLIMVIYDARVVWWESLLLMTMYGIYIIIMKFNSQILVFVTRQLRSVRPCCLKSADHRADKMGEDASACNTSMVLLGKGQAHGQEPPPVIMVDELLILNPHKLSFSEAGLRIMITPHFSPRTRLSMAGRMLISERQRLIRTLKNQRDGEASPGSRGGSTSNSLKRTGSCSLENGGGRPGIGDAELGDKPGVEVCQPEEEEEDEDGIFSPVRIPGGCCARVKWVITWPLGLLLYCTVPNCILPRWHRWFMVTFVASTLWIAVFSYLMVWMVSIISFTLDIPDYIMGITFLAAGTSVPDCMASLIVARQGMGDMAVSNSIGSNIFDILLGLGFPWALRTLVVDHGSIVSINNKGLVYSVILLLASVFLTVMSVHLNHWKLDRRLGLGLMFLYAIFLLCSILFGQM